MSLFGKFEHPLKSNVGSNHTNDPHDIVKTKRHLNKLGYFVEDTEGPFITKALENGIIKYQKDNNLRIDGVMKPGGETERSMFEVLAKKPADILWDYKEDDSVGIGFGGNVTGTLPPRKVPKIREDALIQERTQKQKEAPQPPPTQAERALGSIDAITAAISAAKGNTKRSRENRGVFKTAEILARVHEEAKRRKEQNMMSISSEKSFTPQGTEDSAMSSSKLRPEDKESGAQDIADHPKSQVNTQSKKKVLPPPTDAPIKKEDLYSALDYKKKGRGDFGNFIRYGTKPNDIALEAEKISKQKFPKMSGYLDDSDAFRHALASYMMTQEYGGKVSKEILDGHERKPTGNLSSKDTEGGLLQDLYNNHVGRTAALDPKNKDRNPVEVVEELYKSGVLQTQAFIFDE